MQLLRGLTLLDRLKLGLDDCIEIDPSTGMHRSLCRLQRLYLTGSIVIEAADMAHLLGLRDHLRELILIGCSSLTDAGLQTIAELKQLSSLSLRGSNAITDAGVAHLAGLPQLQSLDLSWCKDVTDASMAHIVKGRCGPTLRMLGFSACRRVGDVGLLHLANGVPALEKLDATIGLSAHSGARSNMSDAARRAFKQSHPQCEVCY